jgi:hypothetical protein
MEQLAFVGLEGEQLDRAQLLARWWKDVAHEEINMVVPKAIEYGAVDLIVMGSALVKLLPGWMTDKMERAEIEQVGQEMACAFYALGKVSRVFGALEQGRRPSDDTWADLGIYCRMAQRIRAFGRWG